MADVPPRRFYSLRVILFFFIIIPCWLVSSNPVTVPVENVPLRLLQAALDTLNQDSPTHHSYKDGNLISAQKLLEAGYTVYRLTFDLKPICKDTLEPCPREACTVQAKQDQAGLIDVLPDSIQCMYLFPQSAQYDPTQSQEALPDQEPTADNTNRQVVDNQTVELDHEIETTGDQSDKPFIAMRASPPKYCPGCPYDLNPNMPGLSRFGNQAVRSMDEVTSSDYKHTILDILRVTRAVLPSSKVIQFRIVFRIGESNCLKNAVTDEADCSLRHDSPIQLCLVTFEVEPWQESEQRVVANNCTMNTAGSVSRTGDLPEKEASDESTTREKAIEEKMNALEGLKEILENFTYATVATNQQKAAGIDNRGREVTEDRSIKIVLNRTDDDTPVPGFIDKVAEFGEYLEELGLPRGRKTEDAEGVLSVDDTKDRSALRQKRDGATSVGAPISKDVNDPEIQEFAKQGLHKFSENSEGPNEPVIVQVSQASAQVVAGMLYKIKVKLGTSDCPKGVKENCQLKAGSEIKECLFTIWSRPWLNQQPEITINCEMNNRRKRSLRGANYNLKMLQQAQDAEAETLFEDFLRTYDKLYSNEQEKKFRLSVFKENLRVISELRKYEQGTAVYGITKFADLTYEEFRKHFLGLKLDIQSENGIPFPEGQIPDIDLPEKYDWREHNVVTSVKDQGQCGSCWAFSVTGNIEGQYAIKHGKLLSLSEQELVDCDMLDDGCEGGLPDNAYRAIESLGGLESESDYPYDGEDEKCHFNKEKAKVRLTSAVNITSNETDMAKWLVQNGPISIGINANAMQFYMGGVSHPFNFLCNPNSLDHGVLIVGYGISRYPLFHKELPYWIIKNSWGPRWGEQGYYRVYRGDGTCGLNRMASSAVVA